MTLEQKIFSKLEPHAKRIQDGDGNDFDYLPAILLQIIEEQKRQAKLLDDTVILLDSIKSSSITQFQNSQSSMNEQFVKLTNAQAEDTKKTNENLNSIVLSIESLGSSAQRFHMTLMRLLITGVVASAVVIGLAIAILQGH